MEERENDIVNGEVGASPPKRLPMREAKRTIARWRVYGVRACAVIMALGCVVGLLFFLRPAISEAENRTLTKFPEFTVETFLNGAYFTEVSLWYADTYPLREPMVSADRGMENLFGVKPSVQLIGGNRTSDELPVEGAGAGEGGEGASSESSPRYQSYVPREDVVDQQTTEEARVHQHDIATPEDRYRAEEMESAIVDGVYVDTAKEACYTLYYFDQDATQRYADVINQAAEMLKGKATVYSVLLPTNAGVMLDDSTLKQLGVPNQEQAINYFYSLMGDNVYTVDSYSVLADHKDEYLYFRTDHHWTQLAAYYVYKQFCKVKGIDPPPYEDWDELVFEPFLGEYVVARDNGFDPDSVVARIPQGTNDLVYWVDDLDPYSKMDGWVVSDLTNADASENRYGCFGGGNRPLTIVENPAVKDDSSCLLVKDSYGNPFLTVMVDNYHTIYAIDPRFTNEDLVTLVDTYHIKDVIFENVLMFAGTYNMSDMLRMVIDGTYAPTTITDANAASTGNAG